MEDKVSGTRMQEAVPAAITREGLEEMARDAVWEGDHSRFVKVFLGTGYKGSADGGGTAFSNLLCRYITEYTKRKKQLRDSNLLSYTNFKIMQESFWCMEDFAYTEAHLSGDYIYSKSNLSCWKNGVNTPSRTAIFQLAFWLLLDEEKLNDLLRTAGEPSLYILDPMDKYVSLCLRKYSKENEGEINIFKRLQYVKSGINRLLRQTDGDFLAFRRCEQTVITSPEAQLDSMEADALNSLPGAWRMYWGKYRFDLRTPETLTIPENVRKKYGINVKESSGESVILQISLPEHPENRELQRRTLVWNLTKGKVSRLQFQGELMLAHASDLGLGINEEIERLRRELPEEMEKTEKIGNTNILTKSYEERLKDIDDPEEFLRTVDAEHGILKVPFARKRYGFLRKTTQFLASEKWIKNLRWSNLALTAKDCFSESMLDGKGNFLNDLCRRYGEKLEKGALSRLTEEAVRERRLNVLNMIWQVRSSVEDEEAKFTPGGFTTVRNMNQGRDIEFRPKYRAVGKELEKNPPGYLFDMGSRQRLMKYAVATGNENELGRYLVLAGYWDRDWTGDGMEEKDGEETLGWKKLDRSDYLILYALAYRDALIENWSRQTTRNQAIFRDNARARFPMISLLLTIEEWILMKAEQLAEREGRACDPKKYMDEVQKDLIYYSPERT